jgi:hypothetical protein
MKWQNRDEQYLTDTIAFCDLLRNVQNAFDFKMFQYEKQRP